MNCQEFWTRLSKPPGMEAELGPEHRGHLAACAMCAAHLARQGELATGLRRLAEGYSGLRAPARVEGRLLRAFRAENGVVPKAERNGWLVPLCWAAAATLLLAAGLYLNSTRQPAPVRSTPMATELAVAEADADAPDADGFIPLPNAERIGPNDDVNLVRMEVPRSTLVALGIAVNADQASDRVEADVLLGADGLARAVRFLD